MGNGKWIKDIRKLSTKRGREEAGLFVAEGPKVVGDLIAAGWHPVAVYVSSTYSTTLPPKGENEGGFPTHTLVSEETLRRISFLQHPQGIVGIFRLPESLHHKDYSPILARVVGSEAEPELFLALDGVQDPGNVGTIIRIADWFGIDRIYCSPDTADAYAPKVVQASMGSIARVKIVYTDLVELIKSLPADYPVYGTLLDGENIYDQTLTPHGLIVMGNEGNGISAEVRSLITKPLLIPSFKAGAESLNVAVATAITCSEFRRNPS